MRYSIQTFLNDGPGRFSEYQSGDRLYAGPVVLIEVDEDVRPHAFLGHTRKSHDSMVFEALDKAWAVGNRMEVDSDAQVWPSTVRSLSSGDVVVINFDGHQAQWAVSPVGFTAITVGELTLSLSPESNVSDRGAFGPPVICDCGKGALCPEVQAKAALL